MNNYYLDENKKQKLIILFVIIFDLKEKKDYFISLKHTGTGVKKETYMTNEYQLLFRYYKFYYQIHHIYFQNQNYINKYFIKWFSLNQMNLNFINKNNYKYLKPNFIYTINSIQTFQPWDLGTLEPLKHWNL